MLCARLIQPPNLYRMKIARSANRIAVSLWLNAYIVATVSGFTKFIAAPAPDVAIRRQRAAIPRTDGNLSGVFHAFHFDSAFDEFCRAIAQLPDGIEAAPTIHFALFDRAGMVKVRSDEAHTGLQARNRSRGEIPHRISGSFPQRAGKVVSPAFQPFGVHAAREVLRIRARSGERMNFSLQPNDILHHELRTFFFRLIFHRPALEASAGHDRALRITGG